MMTKLVRPLRDHKGFSLIEVLMTIVIISISLWGISYAMRTGWMGVSHLAKAQIAARMVQEQMDTFRMGVDRDPLFFNNSISTNATGITQKGVTVTWVVTTENPIHPGDLDTRKIVFTASWNTLFSNDAVQVTNYICQ